MLIPGQVQEEPAYCLGGVRHKGAVSLNQALVRNVGNCRPDVKGEAQVEDPQVGEYRGGAQWRNNP